MLMLNYTNNDLLQELFNLSKLMIRMELISHSTSIALFIGFLAYFSINV